jgi:hypothetical protein
VIGDTPAIRMVHRRRKRGAQLRYESASLSGGVSREVQIVGRRTARS